MKVQVERHIEQVTDGTHCKGHVKIADTKFDFDLKFSVPIPKLAEATPPKGPDGVRQLIRITLKKGAEAIELTDEEYKFFLRMLAELAVDFYHNPQTRDSNQGILGLAAHGVFPGIGITASFGMTNSGSYDFPPHLCLLLSSPKFGCALADNKPSRKRKHA